MIETLGHNRRNRCVALMAIMLLVGLGVETAWADLDQELVRADQQVSALEDKADLVLQEFIRYDDKSTKLTRFEARLTDAQAMLLLKDYSRASVVFYDLVEYAANRTHPAYVDALFGLAESLFANRNFIDARKYFLRLLDQKFERRYLISALTRLMEISLRMNEYSRVDEFYRQISKISATPPVLATYLWAKTLSSRNRLQEAAQTFSLIEVGSPFYFQARYYLGVIYVQQNRLKSALEIYQALSKMQARSDREAKVLELANLARGRLLHDLNKSTDALDAYQAIEHTSKYFDSALYEICWTYIQQADDAKRPKDTEKWYLEALRTAEILEVSTPDSALVPKAKLLEGYILEKVGKYERAREIFDRVSSTYSSVKQELETLLKQHDDPVGYFNEVAGKNLDSFDLRSYLPPLAVKWVTSQDEMTIALNVVKEIDAGRKFVSDSQALLERFNTLLENEQERINLFPHLRNGAKRVLEIENSRILLERKLSWVEEKIIIEHISEKEQERFNAIRNQRLKLEDLVGKLPTTKDEFDSRELKIKKRIDLLEKAVYESAIAIKGMKAQLRAMDIWIQQNRDKLKGKTEAVAEFREEIHQGWKVAESIEDELNTLAVLLATEKSRAGLDSQTLTEEAKLRDRYMETLKSERELAEQLYSRLDSEGVSQVHRINDLRLRIDVARRKLQTIHKELYVRVDEKAKGLKAQADSEEKRLRAFEQTLNRLEKESENLAGDVAYQTLDDLRKKFGRLILDADVGILDLAWKKKQDKTAEITDISRKQALDQKRLYEEYESVLEEAR